MCSGAAKRLVQWMGLWLTLICTGAAEPDRLTVANDPVAGSDLVIRSWGTEAGLPQNTINAILQTQDGYLWLATRDGLARFDGVRFTVFGLSEGLESVEVQTLYEDRQKTLWIGTSGGGLSRLVDGRIQSVPVAGDVVTSLAEDAEGRLLAGTIAGLSLWKNGRFVSDPALAEIDRAGIRALMRDRQGTLWIATQSKGLFEFRENQLRESRGPAGNEKIVAYCLLEDQAGRIWASVGDGKVLCRRSGEWGKYDQTGGLPFAYITSLAQEEDGTVWAGSLDDGLYRFQEGHFVALRKENGLSANDIRSLFPDREGNLWVGTRTAGLNRLSRRKLLHAGVAQGLTNEFTRSVAQTADGSLWVGTVGGGLYRGEPWRFEPFAPQAEASFYSSVEAVLSTPDGSLWWGGARALLRWRDGHLADCYTNESWIRAAAVTALSGDLEGGLWIGTSEGRLVRWRNGEFKEFAPAISRGAITALAPQAGNVLWVGSMAGGLKRIEDGSNSVLSVTNGLLSQAVRTLYLDAEQTLWIGTAGGGLSRWKEGRVANFTARQGLAADTVSQIVEDDGGNLWLGCGRGIWRVRKTDLNELAAGKISFIHPRAFGRSDGMPVEECSSGFCPAGLKTKAGLICISTVKGLVFFDPRRSDGNAAPPQVLLEETLVNGEVFPPETALRKKAVGPDRDEAQEAGLRERPVSLSVPPGGREVELHYTAISFAAPEKVRFRYRLEGIDNDWIEAGERRIAYYHHLPAGAFVFRVIACNADNIWSEPGPELGITVQPYLWQRTWFQVLAALSLLGILASAVRLTERRRYKRHLALVETEHAVERERLRISQDMHDDIGSILTQVSQLSEFGQNETGNAGAKEQFERIGEQARSAVQALDEIVWAVNPRNDNLPQFAEYVCRFADECLEATAVRCWQEVPTGLPKVPLRADVRHNVFLATKEALTNVLKHAKATEVWLRLGLSGGEAHLEVEDDGRGFAPDTVTPGGNGLGNMRARLLECGGKAEIVSKPSQGTIVRFSFPLPKITGDEL